MSGDEQQGGNLPTGRWARLTRLASTGARSGAQFLLNRSSENAAEKAAAVLGQMRGVAAKAGQMAGYVDGLVPEEHREAYERWMQGLLSATKASPPQAIRQSLERSLAQPLEALFAHWEATPIASASIGQVHRAQLHDGRQVAVKVQHPGVAVAMESDLKNAGMLENLTAAMGSRHFDSKQVLREFRARLREELDFSLEAEHAQRFTALHAGDPRIHIPAVIATHSHRTVLTTEFVEGLNFAAAVAAPEADRRAWAETLWRFVFKSILIGGMFNADPHPGNYIFHPNGRVSFIDFGCVQMQERARQPLAVAVHQAALQGDMSAFEQAVVTLLQTRGGSYERWALDYVRHCFEPVLASPYRITRSYAASMVESIRSLALRAHKLKKDKLVPLPKGMFFMNRLQCGFYSVLARLDVEVDYATVERQLLAEAGLWPA